MEASSTLNRSEQKRLLVLNAGVAGQSTVAEAAASLGLSVRQVRRVLAAYQREGAAALAHGNRGGRPAHATRQEVAQQVVILATTTYQGCNQQHLRDLLAEREEIVLSRATVHRLLVAGVDSLEAANAYLPRFNAQFAVPAATPGSAYRLLEPTQELAAICCFTYTRVVAADNTVTFGPHRLQLQPGPTRRSYAHARVAVQERLDGSLVVCSGGQCLHTTPAPPEAPLLRARKRRAAPAATAAVPAPWSSQRTAGPRPDPAPSTRPGLGSRSGPPPADHPWRRPLTPIGAARGQTH